MCRLVLYQCQSTVERELLSLLPPEESGRLLSTRDVDDLPAGSGEDLLVIAPTQLPTNHLHRIQETLQGNSAVLLGLGKDKTELESGDPFQAVFAWPEEKAQVLAFVRSKLFSSRDAVFSSLPIPALLLDPVNGFYHANGAFRDLLNSPTSGWISDFAENTHSPNDPARALTQLFRALRAQQDTVSITLSSGKERRYRLCRSQLQTDDSLELVTLQDITDWLQTEREWKQRWKYQKLISDITQLAFESDDLDTFLNRALQQIGQITQVSRVYIFQDSPDGKFTSNTHEWVNEGIVPFKDELQNIPYADVPYWKQKLEADEVILAQDIQRDLPPELHEILEKQGIKSLLVVPLRIEGQRYGFMGLDECAYHRDWHPEDIALLRGLAHVLELAILNKRIQAENLRILGALRASEREKAAILQSAPQGIALIRNHRIVYHNRGLEELLGYSAGELASMEIEKLLGQVSLAGQCVPGPREGALGRGVHRDECRLKRKDGTEITCLVSGSRVDGEKDGPAPGILLVFTDITQLRRAQEALQESEARYATLVEKSSDGIVVLQGEGVFRFVNDRFCEITGFRREELIGKHFSNFVPIDLREQLMSKYNLRMSDTVSEDRYSTQILTRDGNIRQVEIDAKKVKLSGEDADLLYVRDVTKEQELLSQLQFQASFLQNTSVFAFATDVHGRITYLNPAAKVAFGLDDTSQSARFIFELTSIRSEEDWTFLVKQIQESGAIDLEVKIAAGPGKYSMDILLTLVGLNNSEGQLETITCIGTDISDLKRQERQLVAANRELQALHQLASTLSESLELREILASALHSVLSFVRLSRGALFLFKPEARRLDLAVSEGLDAGLESALASKRFRSTADADRFARKPTAVWSRGFFSPRQWEELRGREMRSALIAPLSGKGGLVGALAVFSPSKASSATAAAELLAKLRPQLSGILENALLHDAMGRRARRMTALARAILATNRLDQNEDFFAAFARILVEELGVYHSWIALADDREKVLRCVAAAGESMPEELATLRLPLKGNQPCPPVQCLRENKVEIFRDINRYPVPKYLEIFKELGVSSVMFVPVPGTGGKSAGVLAVTLRLGQDFQEEDKVALTYFAEQLHTAMENRELVRQLSTNYRKVTRLQEMSKQIAASLRLHQVLRFTCRSIVDILGYDAAWIGLQMDGQPFIQPASQYGLDKSLFKQLKRTLRETPEQMKPLLDILKSDSPHTMPDIAAMEKPPYFVRALLEAGMRSCAAFPLHLNDQNGGVLVAYSKSPFSFSEHDISIIQTFASQVAVSIRNAQLFDQVRKNMQEVRAKNRELEAFVYTVSHDLKAPVISMNGFSQLLLESYGRRLDKEGRFYLERIRENAHLMEQLINDLLDLSRVGRVVGRARPFQIGEVLRNVITSLEPQLREKGLRITVPENLPTVSGDSGRIGQVFKNLLHNAIKFSPAGKNATIEVLYREQKREHLFGVRDHGPGIDPKYHERIFDLFYRLSGEGGEGTGIGLTIAKRIIEHHGGKIWVHSQPDSGATFYFTLPKGRRVR